MERKTALGEAANIFGSNFIGPDEIALFSGDIGVEMPTQIPDIPFDLDFLKTKKNDHLLFLSSCKMISGGPVSLMALRDFFGIDPNRKVPCFYNQDWYLNEPFFRKHLDCRWNLIRKEVSDDSRAKNPDRLTEHFSFPSAVLCAYAFFLYSIVNKEYLWMYDYIWCNDFDHNNDRIYVGCYSDREQIKKDGFEIHRHLSFKLSYGAINCF